jgi:hypothetical protein
VKTDTIDATGRLTTRSHEEEGKYRTQEVRSPKAKQPGFLTLDEMLLMLAEVNKFLKKQNRTAVGNTTLAFLCK